MRLFGSDRIAKVMDRMGVEEGEVITHAMVTKSIERAQKKVEGRNFSIRKHLLEYDDVMNQQREIVYDRRNYALTGINISREVDGIMDEYIDDLIDTFCSSGNSPRDWAWDEFSEEVLQTFSLEIKSENEHINTRDELRDMVVQGANAILTYKKESIDEKLFDQFQKWVVLRTIDEKWREHLAGMDQLREGIGLRAYGQKNPLIEYKQEGFGMFAEMMVDTNQETMKRIFRTNIQKEEHKPAAPRPIPVNLKMKHDEAGGLGFVPPPQGAGRGVQPQVSGGPPQTRQPLTAEKKIGRNDPCICGSGKKYKKCCGGAAG
jgi:preprotein translocase subunit SecA